MGKRTTVLPPRPDLIRQPAGRFGWLEDPLLREDWPSRLGPEGTSALVLLALAADRHDASFYGREYMPERLGISRQDDATAAPAAVAGRSDAARGTRYGVARQIMTRS